MSELMTAREYILSFAATIFDRLFDLPREEYDQAMVQLERRINDSAFIQNNGNTKFEFEEVPDDKADIFVPEVEGKRARVELSCAVDITMSQVKKIIQQWKEDLVES